MRGIRFNVFNGENVLANIFHSIDCENYWWSISEDEIYNKTNEPIFTKNYIDGEKFNNIIRNQEHFVIFANIKAYSPNIFPENLETYYDFINSECKLNLFCCDVNFYEVYAKDNSLIEKIRKNALVNGFENIEFITDENDERTRFSVI